MINALLERRPRLANWIYGFAPPEHGTVVLVHRRGAYLSGATRALMALLADRR